MNRQKYINLVGDRLLAMVNSDPRLPCQFKPSGGWATQTDGPIFLYFDPTTPHEGIFEGVEIFADLQRQINEEFKDNRWYFGIRLGVPHRFLGQKHMKEMQEQAEDNQRYRSIRLDRKE